MSLTPQARRLLVDLLEGGYLLPWKRPSGTFCYRLYKQKGNPIRNIRQSTAGVLWYCRVLNKDNATLKLTISRAQIRKLRANHIIKVIYKRLQQGEQVTINNKSLKQNEKSKERDSRGQIPLQF